jgi:hypothetical protein
VNLDDRARRARNSLQNHVRSDLDLSDARASLEARARRQRSDRRRARVAAVGLSVVALLGGIAVVSASNEPDDTRRPDELAVDDRDRDPISDDAVLEAMPLGPTDGKESWRLPVAASPQDGLQEGDVVTIYGRGFDPHDSLGVVHCGWEADVENAGVNGCDLAGGSGGYSGVQYVSADANGDVVAEITVRRFIETPGYGRIDCASAPERCLLGMGAISNYDRSGGVYINFAGAPEFAAPTFQVSPDPGQLTPGQQVQVDVTGWVPGRQIRIRQCALGEGGFDGTERCQPLLDTRADGAGAFTGTVTVNAEVVDDDGAVPCEGNCVLEATGIGIPEGTTAPVPAAVAISFAEGSAEETTTTHAGTTTTPPPVAGNPATEVPPETQVAPTTIAGGGTTVDDAGTGADGTEAGETTTSVTG